MRLGFGRGYAVLVAVALNLAALPAGAAGAAPVAGADGEAFGASVTFEPGGALQRAVEGRRPAAGVLDHRDRGAWMAALADFYRDRLRAPVLAAGLPSVDPDATEAAEESEEEPYEGSWADAVEIGDVDGDGAGDLAMYDIDLNDWSMSMRALSGRDGTTLWERSADDGGLASPVDADVNGNGTPDLFSIGLEILEESGTFCEEQPSCSYEASFQWTLAMVEGADGSQIWGDVVAGWLVEELHDESTPLTQDYRYVLSGDNLGIYAFPARAGEIAVVALSLDEEHAYRSQGFSLLSTSTESWHQRTATSAEVRSGADGTVRITRSSDDSHDLMLLLPAGDLLGDAGDDLLWERNGGFGSGTVTCERILLTEDCEYDGEADNPVYGITAVDGATGEEGWTNEAPFDYGVAVPLDADVDADGRDELWRWADQETEDGLIASSDLLSGADGTRLWGEQSDWDWIFPLVIAPLDDSPGDDIVTGSFSRGDANDYTVNIDRRNGATGEVFSTTSHTRTAPPSDPEAGEWHYIEASLRGGEDVDADGAQDLHIGFSEHHETDDMWTIPSSEALVESARSGATLYHAAAAGDLRVDPGADFDGDGSADLLARHRSADRGAGTLSVVSVSRDAALWSHDIAGGWTYAMAVADQDGVAGSDVVLLRDGEDGNRIWTDVTSLSGTTGQSRWTVRSRP